MHTKQAKTKQQGQVLKFIIGHIKLVLKCSIYDVISLSLNNYDHNLGVLHTEIGPSSRVNKNW